MRVVSRPLPLLAALVISLVLAAPAHAAFSGATIRGTRVSATYGGVHLLPRVVCPPFTTSTGRPGDFSFCTGDALFYVGRRLVATGPFSVRTYDSHIEFMNVLRSARSLFRPGRFPRVRWVLRSHDGQGQRAVRAGSFTVYNPFRR